MKSDSQLKKDIEAELEWDPAINAAQVGVSVKNGVVSLSGHLDTYAEKRAVEKAVQRVSGVQALAVELDVKLAPDHVRTDAEIAAAVESALLWHSLVPHERIKVKVEKGWVNLSGEVEWDYQRRSADNAVRPLLGVVGVSNYISIKPTVTPTDITKRIQEALTRQAEREGKNITVALSGSTVTLRGSVHSWAERNAAQGGAWSAPGITNVVNELKVLG